MVCLIYSYSYVKYKKQRVIVNNIQSSFQEIISWVRQGSVIGLFYVIATSAQKFADDKTLSSFAKTIENLISVLESENNRAIKRV